MLFVREFEIVADEGGYLAIPFGMEGGTEGETREGTVAMAADWLRAAALDSLLHGYVLPGGSVFHAPREDGWVVAVAVDVDVSDAPAVTSAEAARALGVSTARVAQMCSSGQLASWKVGSPRMVAKESIEERLAIAPQPGRPSTRIREIVTA